MIRVLVWATFVVTALPSGLLSQEAKIIPLGVGCSACSIAVDTLAVLGNVSDPIILMPESRFEALADGSFVAYQTSDPGVLVHYNPDGQFVRAFGSEGSGPKEFSSLIEGLRVADSDSLFVLDRNNRRVAVLDPQFEVAYTVPIEGDLYDVLPLNEHGVFLVQGWIPTGENRGFPLHEVAVDTRVPTPVMAAQLPEGMPPAAIPPTPSDATAEGAGWLVGWYDYTLTEFDIERGQVRSFRREVSWFPDGPTGIRDLNNRSLNPKAIAYDLQLDARGRVWLAIWVEASEGSGVIAPEQPLPEAAEAARRFDTIIEVFDPTTGSVVLSQRFDETFGRFAGQGRISLLSEDRSGYQRWAILALTIEGLTP